MTVEKWASCCFRVSVRVLLVLACWGWCERPLIGAEVNLVYNGSFEVREPGEPNRHIDTVTPDREDLIAWLVTGKSVDWIGPTRWKASHGEFCLDIDAPGGVLQKIATTPGRKYRLTFDLAGNVETEPLHKTLNVSIDDQQHQFHFYATGNTRADLGWVQREIVFTATKKRTTLAFTNASKQPSASGVALDNVVVTPVAEKPR